MLCMLYIFLILFFLLFIPIPIKIKLIYNNFNLNIFLYNFKINLEKKIKSEKKVINKPKLNKNFCYYISSIKTIVHNIDCSKHKPKLNINIKLKLGFFDASITALIYGLLNSFSPLIYRALSIIFKVKKYKFDINPEFNEDIICIELKSIIFINFAKIIYIFMSLKKSISEAKKCTNNNFNI